MKTLLFASLTVLGLALAADADAARRFGGGSNLGKQRATPTQREATPAQSPAAAPAPATPAGSPPLAPKPSFMGRFGGLLAGLGIGLLLSSLFGAQMGPIVGMILMVLAVAGIALLLYKLFARRGEPPAARSAPAFAGIGSRADPPPSMEYRQSSPAVLAEGPSLPKPSFEAEPFLRVAKTSFIRLQAANDARDLDDIRDYTTPEVYAEIAMQIKERGEAPQRTEVVNLNADLIETAVEGDYEIASVRFHGLIREDDAANPEPFDEIWHVRKDRRDRRGSWLISGIQQAA
jgi:predicted lipid-binding transport protein (Tim44 family)